MLGMWTFEDCNVCRSYQILKSRRILVKGVGPLWVFEFHPPDQSLRIFSIPGCNCGKLFWDPVHCRLGFIAGPLCVWSAVEQADHLHWLSELSRIESFPLVFLTFPVWTRRVIRLLDGMIQAFLECNSFCPVSYWLLTRVILVIFEEVVIRHIFIAMQPIGWLSGC